MMIKKGCQYLVVLREVNLSFKIINECISCDACASDCPTDAISVADPIYIINPKICCECVGYEEASICVLVCPVDSIILDENYIDTKESLLKKFENSKK